MKLFATVLVFEALNLLAPIVNSQSILSSDQPDSEPKRDGSDKCRIIAMSGGSNHGAWEAGVLWGLVHYGDPADFTWNIVSGVSAGSLNTAMTAYFEVGDELEMTEYMSDKWASAKTHDIWTFRRHPGPVRSIWEEQSVLDDEPGLEFIQGVINELGDIKRNFIFGSVDVNTGEYQHLDHTNVTKDTMAVAALGSASIPFVFPPRPYEDKLLMDGGTAWNINLDSAMLQCTQLGFEQKDIIVDMTVVAYLNPTTEEETSKDALSNYLETRNLRKYYYSMNSLQAEQRAYPDVEYRYFFQDRHHCDGKYGQLDFDNSTTWCYQEKGREDAKKMLDIGQDNIHKTLEEWFEHQETQDKYPNFRDYLNSVFNL